VWFRVKVFLHGEQTMSDVRLNFARKWRARGFDQIIGQDLTVRILKNSLYVGSYFPVYLLRGQRGSGKTSMARIFASAINCQQLDNFRKSPKECPIPCLQCDSCRAMLAGKHPDFIEMDAASHTGVDNVRQIIDAASLMPLLGRKKIYLIDEAHMLSKAAFNSFLKILEEPPASVLFMLATTDPEKIIDTVKSRCFQFFFKPVASSPLLNHLEAICKAEEIVYESEALSLIIKESGGSVRDALNLLEQVRFASASVNKSDVIQVLGHMDDERLFNLFEILLYRGTIQLLPFLEELNIRLFSAEHLWTRLVSIIRAAIWLSHNIEPAQYHERTDQLRAIIQRSSLKKLTKLLERFYKQEPLFLKTTDKHLFLEILLLQACQRNDTTSNSNTSSAVSLPPPVQHEGDEEKSEYIEEEEEIEEEDDESDEVQRKKGKNGVNIQWDNFLVQIEQRDDPLLASIFKQGVFSGFDVDAVIVTVVFSKEFVFFNEWLDNSRSLWHPLLQNVFGESVVLNPLFTLKGQSVGGNCYQVSVARSETSEKKMVNVKDAKKSLSVRLFDTAGASGHQPHYKVSGMVHSQRKVIDVSDVQRWRKTNLLLRYFPGVVSEVS